jgi:hypothetical protein
MQDLLTMKSNRKRYRLHRLCRMDGTTLNARQKTIVQPFDKPVNRFSLRLSEEFNYQIQLSL